MTAAVAIITESNDLHALAVAKELNDSFCITAHVIEWDTVAGRPFVSWTPGRGVRFISRAGIDVRFSDVSVIWWRRSGAAQGLSGDDMDDAIVDYVNRSCSSAINGGLYADFCGVWVSDPVNTSVAANKLVQLSTAERAGLRIPRTLVTNRPPDLRDFVSKYRRAIIKPLQSVNGVPMFTQRVSSADLVEDSRITIAPTIAQEYVDGTTHWRVNCFGDQVSAFKIHTEELDWRIDLSKVTVEPCALPKMIEQQILRVQALLGLQMSVHDLKVAGNGDIYWLEVNPQGQFLFLQGITGIDLIDLFCRFLVDVSTVRSM